MIVPNRQAARAACMLWMMGLCCATPALAAEVPGPHRLAFHVADDLYLNSFLQQGPVAAHLVLRSGTNPRMVVAFPAGDSGVALWFGPVSVPVTWELQRRPEAEVSKDGKGRMLYGISATVAVTAPELTIRHAILSSVRVIRDYESLGTVPAGIDTPPVTTGTTVEWARDRLDGAAGYRLALNVTDGRLQGDHIMAGRDGRIAMTLTALTGEKPLTPLAQADVLNSRASDDRAGRDTLAFLSYREKFLAGSWRFDTYFGRDTLLSLYLLMPALKADAVEDGLDSVLARLSPKGEVAHEEDIGEQAVLDHLKTGVRSDAPVYSYQMIDEDYLLAPLAAAWLLKPHALDRSAAFLAGNVAAPGQSGVTRGEALVRNLRLVLQSAAAFAQAPAIAHLIGLKPGVPVGDWRDGANGLGGGHYPYDVNAALVPAALDAAARLETSGLLAHYLTPADRALFSRAARMASVWQERAPPLFDVVVPHARAAQAIQTYAAAQGIEPGAALKALGSGDVHFHALALDVSGKPIPVMQSDEGFRLLFGHPDARSLDAIAALIRPFPAGLLTGVGMLVANPAFCAAKCQALFTPNEYQGAVIWSWQQALFAAGLARQLERPDLPAATRVRLRQAQRRLWAAIDATRSLQNAELWSWTYRDGHYRARPFGASDADVTESDAAQLWSVVYLAIRRPQE